MAQFRLTPPTAAVAWLLDARECCYCVRLPPLQVSGRGTQRAAADGSTRAGPWPSGNSAARAASVYFCDLVGRVLLVGALASSSQSAAYAVASRYVITLTFARMHRIAPSSRSSVGLSRGLEKRATDLPGIDVAGVMAITWPALVILVMSMSS